MLCSILEPDAQIPLALEENADRFMTVRTRQ
jgi:hypothetical protein